MKKSAKRFASRLLSPFWGHQTAFQEKWYGSAFFGDRFVGKEGV
jgi:hypothetical protein